MEHLVFPLARRPLLQLENECGHLRLGPGLHLGVAACDQALEPLEPDRGGLLLVVLLGDDGGERPEEQQRQGDKEAQPVLAGAMDSPAASMVLTTQRIRGGQGRSPGSGFQVVSCHAGLSRKGDAVGSSAS